MRAGARPQVAVAVLGQADDTVLGEPVVVGVAPQPPRLRSRRGRHGPPSRSCRRGSAASRPPAGRRPATRWESKRSNRGRPGAGSAGRRSERVEASRGRDPEAVPDVEQQRADRLPARGRRIGIGDPAAVGEAVQEPGPRAHPEPARAVGGERRHPAPRRADASLTGSKAPVPPRRKSPPSAAASASQTGRLGEQPDDLPKRPAPCGAGRKIRPVAPAAFRDAPDRRSCPPGGRRPALQQRGDVGARQTLPRVVADEAGAVEAAEPAVGADPQESPGILQDRVDPRCPPSRRRRYRRGPAGSPPRRGARRRRPAGLGSRSAGAVLREGA